VFASAVPAIVSRVQGSRCVAAAGDATPDRIHPPLPALHTGIGRRAVFDEAIEKNERVAKSIEVLK
jgi:hypothetical protein